jgi:hypothetical protein
MLRKELINYKKLGKIKEEFEEIFEKILVNNRNVITYLLLI